MVTMTETGSSKLDSFKLLLAVVLLVAGIGGFYYLEDQSLLYRVLGLLGVVVLALGVVYTTAMGKTVAGFLRESRTEVRKVVWPTRQETMQTTLIVIVVVILVGISLWLLDMLLLWGVKLLTGQGG